MTVVNGRTKEIIKKLANELEISDSRYESAEKSYLSIGEWLNRPESTLANANTKVYLQGSFRLGTAIKPLNESSEEYDLDMVCEVDIDKAQITPEELQLKLGTELIAYAKAHGMEKPERWYRCWVLNYSESARFHIDFLPAIPDGRYQRRILNEASLNVGAYIDKSIAITDQRHPNFKRISSDWLVSNPNGYADWFKEQMNRAVVLNEKNMARGRVDVADMPAKQRRDSPLQSAIKILKRHRDLMFVDDPETRPSSIILTTLSGYAYGRETDVFDAILGVLNRVDQFIEHRQDGIWIPNPADSRENFADSWKDNPKMSAHFFDWLESARADFRAAADEQEEQSIVELLAPRLGRRLIERSANMNDRVHNAVQLRQSSNLPTDLLDAPHRRPPRWPVNLRHKLKLTEAKYIQNGFRPADFQSGEIIPKGSRLRFVAQTDVPRPYKLYWQVVNTGDSAKAARHLRGNFDEGVLEQGALVREETAKYPGFHSIQCFIVKDGNCIARSDLMVVAINRY